MNPITMADILQGRVPLFHQPVPQQVGLPRMQPAYPAQSGGLLSDLAAIKDAANAAGAKPAAAKAARTGRQSLDECVDGALDRAYVERARAADRKDPVKRALDDAHDAPGIPRRTGRFVPADSFGKKF